MAERRRPGEVAGPGRDVNRRRAEPRRPTPGGVALRVPVSWAVIAVGTAVLAGIAAGAATVASPRVLLVTAGTRAGMLVAGVACAGIALVGVLLPMSGPLAREAAGVRRRGDRAVVVTAGVWVALVFVGIVARAADAFGVPIDALAAGQLLGWSTELAAGRGMLLTAGCALVVLGCAVARLRDPDRVPPRVPLVAALLGVLTPAVTGHASAAPGHQFAVVTIALHAGAAALWVGGLGGMLALIAARRRLLDEALPRYSTLAGVCLAAVALTGVLNAVLRVETWAALFTTGYGALVLAKTVAIVMIGALGGLARRRLMTGRTPVLRWAGIEVVLMAATLGIAAALTQTGTGIAL